MLANLRRACWSAAGLWMHAFDASLVAVLLRDFDWVLPPRNRPLALLITNGIELWPKFVQGYRTSNALRAASNPLDAWIETTVSALLEPITECVHVYYSHRRYGGGFLPLTRIAEVCGYAATAPCHLAVRHDVGPWLALRALVLLDVEAPATTNAPLSPCASCAAPCRPLFEHALAGEPHGARLNDIAPRWKTWLAVRDSCPIGRNARYSNEQIEYHYTRRRSILD